MAPIFMFQSLSAEVFELILAGAMVTVLVWIFWKKGKSD
jgi:hypothetical protein